MRIRTIAFFGLAALVFALVVAVSPRTATLVQASSDHAIDVLALTKAARNLPEQAFPAH